jgi:hypothetical protein
MQVISDSPRRTVYSSVHNCPSFVKISQIAKMMLFY